MEKGYTIELEIAKVELREDNVVHIEFKHGKTIDQGLHREIQSICIQHRIQRIEKLLITSQDFITTEKEFWQESRKIERLNLGQKIAVIAPGLAERILARHYLVRYKPANPFKIFNNTLSAIQWLHA